MDVVVSDSVELHRAESIMDASNENKIPENDTRTKVQKTYDYISERACFFVSEVRQLKAEVVLFMFMFSTILNKISATTMIMDKICLTHLNYSQYVCTHLNLDVYSKQKDEVEILTNNWHLGHTMISTIPSVVIGAFVGAWSDKYGRKPPLIFALTGVVIDGMGSTLCAYFYDSRVEFYLLSSCFTGFSGGYISIMTVTYSYVSDTTTVGQRTMRYAFMEVALGLSMPLGQLLGGWVYSVAGYVPVFLTSACGNAFCLIWVIFVLEETTGLDTKCTGKEKIRELCSFQPIVESFRATIKKRPNQGRMQILMLFLAMSLGLLSFASTINITYIYVHHLYGWGNTKYSTVSAVFAIMSTISMLVVVPIFRLLKLGDPTLGIVGHASVSLKNVTMGLATTEGWYYLANLLGVLQGLANLAARSRISKVAPRDELGKIFAFLTTAESVLPIAAMAVVSQVFNATLELYPGIVFLGVGMLGVIPIAIYFWLATLRAVNYEEMKEEIEYEEEKHETTRSVSETVEELKQT